MALAAILLAVVLIGDGGAHRYVMEFQTAGQLVKDDDVQVGGRRVGSIKEIELTADNQARIEIEVEEPFAPLREGTRGVIRATSLSGVANRYIALDPGRDDARQLADGALIPASDTTSIVDLDQLFNTLDAPTRRDLQTLIKGFATQYRGKAEEAGEAIEYLNPALSTTRDLVGELTEDEGTLTRFLLSSSKAVSALAERREDLSSLVGTTNATAGAIATEAESLDRALGVLPQTLRRANSTFVNLRATLDDLDDLVAVSKPATRRLEPFLRELRPLVRDARPTIRDLRRAISVAGPDNDLTDATRKLPRLERLARPSLVHSREAITLSMPLLEFIRPYAPDFVGWVKDFSQGAAGYDANGHYARIQPIFNAFQFTENPAGGVLTPIPDSQRLDNLDTGNMQRCPGAALAPLPDSSNPYLGGLSPTRDCRPEHAPAGP